MCAIRGNAARGSEALGGESGEFAPGLGTPEAWAVMGMNVFLGLRYVIWGREGDPDFEEIARRANMLLTRGIAS